MSKPKITFIDLDFIKPREYSQRRKIDNVQELANSIKTVGLIHPIVVDEDNVLIAGGRRFEAYKMLAAENPKTYGKIPTITKESLSIAEKKLIELEENIKRVDLTWQDRVLAIDNLVLAVQELYPHWKQAEVAAYLGMSVFHLHRCSRLTDALMSGDKRVTEAQTLAAAYNIIERMDARKEDNEMNDLSALILDTVAKGDVEEDESETEIVSFADTTTSTKPMSAKEKLARANSGPVFKQANFSDWAATYNGPKFNLIHCDFPYGIDHGNSAQGGAKGRWEAYDDSEDVYWKLIHSLLENRDNFMHQSCHIIFWFSMKFYSETIALFNKLAPEIDINYAPLIWHKTDNKGVIRDAEHTPRHVYETAFFMTRGNRQIIKAVADTYGAPTKKSNAIHISEKPEPVLRHFMQLCVDGYSEVLDPTAGGGSAMRAASSMGAKRVLGLEINPEYVQAAQKEYEIQHALSKLKE